MEMLDAAVVALAGRRIDLQRRRCRDFPLRMSKKLGDAFAKLFTRCMLWHLSVRLLAALISLLWNKPSSLVCAGVSCCPSHLKDSGKPRLLTVPVTGVRCMINRSRPRPQQATFSRSTALLAATPPTRLQTRRLFAKRKRLRVLRNRIGRTV